MVATAEVTQAPLIRAKAIGEVIPAMLRQILIAERRTQETHPTAAVGNGEAPPVRLARHDSRASRQWRFPRARVGQKDNLLGLQPTGNPRVQLPQWFG
jgi:hypothetical protein